MAFAAQLLDELMGRNRNLDPSESRNEIKWNDSDVCKFFLVGFCPYDLFTNTRADLGYCEKIHDEKLKKSYEESPRYGRLGYEDDFVSFLQNLVNDVERRIKRGHSRLALNSTLAPYGNTLLAGKEEEVELLSKKINDLVKEAEELGCEGKVDESQGVLKLSEQLKLERLELEAFIAKEKERFGGDQVAKKMIVCEVCGALLVANDAPQRIDEHLQGKQHMGYAQIRTYLNKRKERIESAENDREERLKREREEREKEREKEREERRLRQEQREKEREKEREERRRKHHRRSRSRSRDRHRRRRSRSRERHRRSRSRDRHHRRHRSRSHDRHHRRSDRSRDRSSHRDRSHDRHRSSHRSEDRERSSNRDHSRDKDDSRRHSSRDKNDEHTTEVEKRQESTDSQPAGDAHMEEVPVSNNAEVENNTDSTSGQSAWVSKFTPIGEAPPVVQQEADMGISTDADASGTAVQQCDSGENNEADPGDYFRSTTDQEGAGVPEDYFKNQTAEGTE